MTTDSATQEPTTLLFLVAVPLLFAVACGSGAQAPPNSQGGALGMVTGGEGNSIGGQYGSSGTSDRAGQPGAGGNATGGVSGTGATTGGSPEIGGFGAHSGSGGEAGGGAERGGSGAGGSSAGSTDGGTADAGSADGGTAGGGPPTRLCIARGSTCLSTDDCLLNQYCKAFQCSPAPSAGTACADERCAAGATCANEQCTPTNILEAGANCDCAGCKCDVGLSCTWDFDLSEDLCTIASAGEGESCSSVPCGDGLYCNEIPGVVMPICRAWDSLGEGCGDTTSAGPTNTCQHGLYCDGVCEPVVGEGELCSTTEWCADGLYCDGRCQPSAVGTECGNGNICQDNSLCSMGLCEVSAGAGEACVLEPCRPGTHCNDPASCGFADTCHLPLYTCVTEAPLGDACDDSGCTSGNICMPKDPAAAAGGPQPGTGDVAHATRIVAGEGFACALLESGRVKCWGRNFEQQTGAALSEKEVFPVSPLNFEDTAVADLRAGTANACALLATGAVKCWGNNDYGQVGIGNVATRLPPTLAVNLGAPAVAVSVADSHTCALLNTAQVKCWGDARNLELGISASQRLPQPGAAMALPGIPAAVAAGASHTCVLLTDGRVVCTGTNSFGQLGLGAQAPTGLPGSAVTLNARVTDLAAGPDANYAVLETGDLMAWGLNLYGVLGVGDVNTRYTPVGPLALGERAVSVSASFTHACALLESGQIKCWGDNTSGTLGIGNVDPQLLPVAVDQGEPATAIAVGMDLTCALFSQGTIKCWGTNTYGGLGLGDTLDRGGTADTVPRLNPPIHL